MKRTVGRLQPKSQPTVLWGFPVRMPRFTIRGMMAIVALTALTAWGGLMAQRSTHSSKLARRYRVHEALSAHCERREKRGADHYESSVSDARQRIADVERDPAQVDELAKIDYERLASQIRTTMGLSIDMLQSKRKNLARYSELRRRNSDLASKYERAARYPWLPVAPDPPERE